MPIKILHIIDHLGLGGAQTIVKGIFEKQQNNMDIFLFGLRKREETSEIKHKNVINYDTKTRYSFAPLKQLRKFILEKKINILHCHLFRSQVFGFLLRTFYFSNISLIFHEHGTIIGNEANTILENYIYGKFIKRSTRLVHTYIAVSNAIKNKLIERSNVPGEKIVTLYNFVDLDKFNPKKFLSVELEKEKLGIKKDDFVVGFAGRIVERKGWKEFVEATNILSKTISNIKFLIAGAGPEKHNLLSLLQSCSLQDEVIVLGYVSNMFQFYSYLDCFVIPSYWEPMGIAAVEAQACCIPVVASNVPGLNEIIHHKENGLLCEAKNEHDLAEKIKIVYNEQSIREKLKANGLKSARTYGIDNFLSELHDIYTQCIKD